MVRFESGKLVWPQGEWPLQRAFDSLGTSASSRSMHAQTAANAVVGRLDGIVTSFIMEEIEGWLMPLYFTLVPLRELHAAAVALRGSVDTGCVHQGRDTE